jgi:hypothetical protein
MLFMAEVILREIRSLIRTSSKGFSILLCKSSAAVSVNNSNSIICRLLYPYFQDNTISLLTGPDQYH